MHKVYEHRKYTISENANRFFSWLKKLSEKVWENVEPREGIFGFQTQRETKWIEGLFDEEIEEYESELGFVFPEIYKFYLRTMNGTDKPAINIYGDGESVAYAPNYYSFPRDLEIIKDKIQWIYREFLVDEEEVQRKNISHIIPIVSHRFLIADNCAENPILSMHGRDSIFEMRQSSKFFSCRYFS